MDAILEAGVEPAIPPLRRHRKDRPGSARTMEAVRRSIQEGQESVCQALQHWPDDGAGGEDRSFADLPMGPKTLASTVLNVDEEAVIVVLRKHTLLPLDDCLYTRQSTIPHLTRSSLHRCLQRHGISRLPDVDGEKPARKRFKAYPIGAAGCLDQWRSQPRFPIDPTEVRTEKGKLHLFVTSRRWPPTNPSAPHLQVRLCQARGKGQPRDRHRLFWKS